MKTKFITTTLLFLLTISIYADHPVRHVKNVVIWGRTLHTHTHSYIHFAFERAFRYLGYHTLWIPVGEDHVVQDDLSKYDLSNSLFIVQALDRNIPIRDDCFYIIHNLDKSKYRHLIARGQCIMLQVYTHDCLKRNDTPLDTCMHYDLKEPIIYLPWATDLLPHEIDEIKEKLPNIKKNNTNVFVGSIYRGGHGNENQIRQFNRAAHEYGITFKHSSNLSMEANIQIVQQALLAPTIVGPWQCEQGYIPCRIFKNISYGAMPITNSQTVYELFDKKIIYHPDAYQLGKLAIERLKTWTIEEQYALMDRVKEKHTYLNRIESLFQFFEMVANYQSKSFS